ncbi:MAG: cell division protein FtsQ/DivIB [Minisyncoccota bacterium]
MKLIGSRRAVRSPEFHKKKEKKRKFFLVLYSILFVLFIISPFYALRQDGLLISSVDVRGNEVTGDIEIKNIVTKNFKGKFLWLIPKSSSLLYPNEKIEKEIMGVIPRIASVSLSLDSANVLGVEIVERKPDSLYCKDVSLYRESKGCYFIDKTGLIYSEAPEFAGGVYFVYVSDPEIEDPIRKQFLTQTEMESLKNFVSSLKNFSLEPKYIVKKIDEYILVLTTGTEVRWNAGQNLENLSADLGSFIRESEISNTELGKLEYLDLRFENKIFYKFSILE